MDFKQSRLCLYAKYLKGCPVALLEGSFGHRVPGSKVYFVAGWDIERMALSLLPADGVGKAVWADLKDVHLLAQSVAVTEKNFPLFFMDEQNQRVYCSPHVRDLDDLRGEIRTMRLGVFLGCLPLSGEIVVFNYPYLGGLFVGKLEYREDGMYDVNDVYKASADMGSIEPFSVSKLIVSIDDIVTHDSIDNEVLAGIYAQTRSLPTEGKEDSHE